MSDYNPILQVLKERAKLLSIEREESGKNGNALIGLEFQLASENYVMESTYISEVLHISSLTPLPCAPEFIIGIINIRGRIVSVIELKRFLNLPVKGLTNLNKVIVVSNNEMEFGILADDISGSVELDISALQSAGAFENAENKGFIKGVTNDNRILLDMEKIINSKRIIINEVV